MERSKRQQLLTGYNGGQQHIVMLNEPYPLIYNYETMQPAIQIGTLNMVSQRDESGEIVVESYPIIRPLILNDENGEINGAGIISPYSMYIGEDDEMSAWRNICLLTRRIDIEDLFMLLQEYCFVEQTMIQDPSDIIQGLIDYCYDIVMPEGEELTICLVRDGTETCWMSGYPIAGGLVDPRTLTDLWFLCAGGGSLPSNVEHMVEYAKYYDRLYMRKNMALPKYKFVTTESEGHDEIDYINETFTEWLEIERKKYQ